MMGLPDLSKVPQIKQMTKDMTSMTQSLATVVSLLREMVELQKQQIAIFNNGKHFEDPYERKAK